MYIMSLAKVAQAVNPPVWEGMEMPNDTNLALDTLFDVSEADDFLEAKDELKGVGELFIHVGDEPPVKKEFDFTLPLVPGGDSQDEIVDPSEIHVEEPEEDIEVEEPDIFDWAARGGIPKFTEWLSHMMQTVPRHSGKDSSGLERVIAYMRALDREISKAVSSDLKSELPIDSLERARDEIHRAVDRCEERYERIVANKYPERKGNKKKKGDVEQEGLVKEGQKAAGVQGRIIITVPLLISHIA